MRQVVGVAKQGNSYLMATVCFVKKKPIIKSLSAEGTAPDRNHPDCKKQVVSTGIAASQLLVRSFSSPLKQKGAAKKTLPFQLEAALPYPLEKTVFHKVYTQREGKMRAQFFITLKRYVHSHLAEWEGVDPDWVGVEPIALYRFSRFVCPLLTSYLIVHIGEKKCQLISVIDGQLDLAMVVRSPLFSVTGAFLDKSCDEENKEKVWEKELMRAKLFLQKKNSLPAGPVLVTGMVDGVESWLTKKKIFSSSLAQLKRDANFSERKLKQFAISIGLALDPLVKDQYSFQLRQKEFTSLRLRKKIDYKAKQGMALSLALCLALCSLSTIKCSQKEKNLQRKLDCLILDHIVPSIQSGAKALPSLKTSQDVMQHLPIELQKKKQSPLFEKIRAMRQLFLQTPSPKNLFLAEPKLTPLLHALSRKAPLGITIISIDYHLDYPSKEQEKPLFCRDDYTITAHITFTADQGEIARTFHDAIVDDPNLTEKTGKITWNRKGNLYEMAFCVQKPCR